MYKTCKYTSILLSVLMLQTLAMVPALAQEADETTRQLLRILWGRDAYGYAQWSYFANIESRKIEGSPYLFGDFTDGVIRLENNQESNVMPMNFNVYDQQIVIEGEEGYLALKGDEIQSFRLITNDAVHEYVRGFSASGLRRAEYVRILNKGAISLLYKPNVSIQEREGSGAYGSDAGKKFVFDEHYYIHLDGETERLKRLNKSHVLRTFGDFRDDMERYTESRNLNLEKEDDVVRLFEYYNTMQAQNSGAA